jgi:peptidylprolyl isomerase
LAKAKEGDRVKVGYVLTLDDDTVIENTENSKPIEFTLNAGEAIPGFEQAVIGMSPGESKTVKIPPEKAYGEYHDDLILEVDRKGLPKDLEPKEGQLLRLKTEKLEPFMVRVIDTSETKVKMDANHPLAGKNLNFEIELLEIL